MLLIPQEMNSHRGWAKQWDTNDPQFRHTVLYAGELEYQEGDPECRTSCCLRAVPGVGTDSCTKICHVTRFSGRGRDVE